MKRAISVFLILSMILCACCTVFAGDSKTNKAKLAADDLYSLGLFSGTGKDAAGNPIYSLERNASRAEAITMLINLLGKSEEAKQGSWKTPFTDVPAWAEPFVGFAYANGLTSGTSATTFGSSDPVTAAQYLTFVLKSLGYEVGKDFQWSKAWELTDKLGITSGEYNEKNNKSFIREDVVIVSDKALYTNMKNGEETLFETVVGESSPISQVPEDKEPKPQPQAHTDSYAAADDYMLRALSDKELRSLMYADIDVVREKVSTLVDAVAYLSQYIGHYYSNMDPDNNGQIRYDYQYAYDRILEGECGGFFFTPVVVYLLEDDYPDCGMIIATEESLHFNYLHASYAVYLPLEDGYFVYSPTEYVNKLADEIDCGDVLSSCVVADLSELHDVSFPQYQYSELPIYQMYAVPSGQLTVSFTSVPDAYIPSYGTIKTIYCVDPALIDADVSSRRRISELQSEQKISRMKSKWSSYQLPKSDNAPDWDAAKTWIDLDLKQAADSISSLTDFLCYIAASTFQPASGDIRVSETDKNGNQIEWHFNSSPQATYSMNCGNCGASSGYCAYMLQGDYDEVGIVQLSFPEGHGGHYINYIKDGSTYYVFDIVNFLDSYSSQWLRMSTGTNLLEAAEKWAESWERDTGEETMLMCAFVSFDGDMPVGGLDRPILCTIPQQYIDNVTILRDGTANSVYRYKIVEMSETTRRRIEACRNEIH